MSWPVTTKITFEHLHRGWISRVFSYFGDVVFESPVVRTKAEAYLLARLESKRQRKAMRIFAAKQRLKLRNDLTPKLWRG